MFSDADRGRAARPARPTRPCGSARRPRASPTCDVDAVLEAAHADRARARSTPATASCPRTPAFARRVRGRRASRSSGRRPTQIDAFGAKHTAARAGRRPPACRCCAGTGLLADADEAVAAAERDRLPGHAEGHRRAAAASACGPAPPPARSGRRVRRASRALAAPNFGSAGVFLERLSTGARHVEVQVFGDGAGGVAVLGDRDCSLQRRNQKVIEEAPAPALPGAVARRCCTTRRARCCASVGYRSAGTVEFVYDADREEASFLEVNTRLQVEHPVTEEVTGVDLVELDAAPGPRGRRRRRRLHARRARRSGHAVEARVYAEDPAQRLTARAPGCVTRAVVPRPDAGVRRRSTAGSRPGTEVIAVLRPDARQGHRARRRPRARGADLLGDGAGREPASTASRPTSACCAR